MFSDFRQRFCGCALCLFSFAAVPHELCNGKESAGYPLTFFSRRGVNSRQKVFKKNPPGLSFLL